MNMNKLVVLLGTLVVALSVVVRGLDGTGMDLGLKPVLVTMQETSGNEAPRVFTLKMVLFTKQYPITTANFIGLCNGIKFRGKDLSYTGTRMHRIIPGFVVQGGDILNGNGTGCVSAVKPDGSKFEDEKDALILAGEKVPERKHDKPGMLAMANSGRNTNGSQFYITLGPNPNEENHFSHLDGKHTVFGTVIEGMTELMQSVQRYEQIMYQETPGFFELKILRTHIPNEANSNDSFGETQVRDTSQAGDTKEEKREAESTTRTREDL